ncbi:hypothetical protein FF38_11621 [Lucilia cuprina]|uniref:Uncharacterized protein n=1 Tax=Lucilia cuprina TaxID=7375 RepID=A0A0L0BXK1_LUCCU|nr:hypothetical protein FF38_11621 [Lucilia cuprina]
MNSLRTKKRQQIKTESVFTKTLYSAQNDAFKLLQENLSINAKTHMTEGRIVVGSLVSVGVKPAQMLKTLLQTDLYITSFTSVGTVKICHIITFPMIYSKSVLGMCARVFISVDPGLSFTPKYKYNNIKVNLNYIYTHFYNTVSLQGVEVRVELKFPEPEKNKKKLTAASVCNGINDYYVDEFLIVNILRLRLMGLLGHGVDGTRRAFVIPPNLVLWM